MGRTVTFHPAVVLAIVVVVVLGAACSSPGSTAVRDADVYAVVIRALVEDTVESADDVVFAGPLDDDLKIPIEVQVDVIGHLEDLVTIRFVDDRSEAFERDREGEPVLGEGLLVLVAAVEEDPPYAVAAERYAHNDEPDGFVAHVDEGDDGWEVSSLVPAA